MSEENDKVEHLRLRTRRDPDETAGKTSGERDYCSFCGKHVSETERLVAGPLVAICDECIAECDRLLGGDCE